MNVVGRAKVQFRRLIDFDHAELLLILGVMLVVGGAIAADYGRSTDEYLHRTYAEQVIEIYAGLRHPADAITNLEYYGPAYNLVSHALAAVFSSSGLLPNKADGWHFSYYLAFLLAAVSVYGISREFMSKGAAITTMLLFSSQPLYFGHAFINPKDIPFLGVFSAVILGGMLVVGLEQKTPPTESKASVDSDSRPAIREIASAWGAARIGKRAIFLGGALLAVLITVGQMYGLWLKLFEQLLSYIYSNSAPGALMQAFQLIAEDAAKTPPEAYLRKVRLLLPWLSSALAILSVLATLACGFSIASGEPVTQITRRHRRWILLGVTAALLGVAISIRIGGAFAGVLISILALGELRKKSLRLLVPTWGFGLVISYALWPFLWGDPLGRAISTLKLVANFPFQGTQLYEGLAYHPHELPRSFLPRMLSLQLTEPVIVLLIVGTISLILMFRAFVARARIWRLAVVGMWFLVPFSYTVLTRAPIYGNFRQLLFITPPLFIVGGLGLDWLLSLLRRPTLRVLVATLVVLPGIVSILQLHPYEYIYYNSLAGGVRGAEGVFSLDAWCTSSREALEYVNRIAEPGARIGYFNRFHLVRPYLREDLEIVQVRNEAEAVEKEVDFVFSCSADHFTGLPVAYQVRVSTVGLAVVRETRPSP